MQRLVSLRSEVRKGERVFIDLLTQLLSLIELATIWIPEIADSLTICVLDMKLDITPSPNSAGK
jgi:hypothetical protein